MRKLFSAKRLVSLLLTLTLLMGIMPVNALAAEDTFTLPAAEYQQILQASGLNTTTWRDGMSWSSFMSAYQKYCYLKDLRDNVLTPVKNRYALAKAKADEYPSMDVSAFSMDSMNRTIYTMGSKLNYFIFDLDTEINAIANAEIVINSAQASTGDKAAAYRRVRKAGERLTQIDNELKKGSFPGNWLTQADELNSRLDDFFTAAEAYAANAKHYTMASYAANEASFHVIILNTDQIGIEVRTPDSVSSPIANAEVTITSGSVSKTARTGNDGVVIFPAGYFTLDSHNRMYAAIKIVKDGYRIWESQSLRVTAGEGLHVTMEKDNGESYVQYVTFRGVDVAHDTEHVYYTPYNDAAQSFKVGIHTFPGHSGVFSLTYTPANTTEPKTITKTVQGTTNGVTELDLKDTWCSMLAPDELVTMEYHELTKAAGSETGSSFFRDTGITTQKAIAEQPVKELTAVPSYLPGTSFDLDIPIGLPGLKGIRISMAFPWELLNLPIHFAMTTSGDFFLSIGIASVKEITDDAKSDSWKTANSQKLAEKYGDFVSGRKSLTDIAKASTRKDGAKVKALDLFKVSFMASFCVLLNGKVTPNPQAARDTDPYKGSMDLFLSAALDATVSFAFPFSVGPVPCHVGFDLSVGIGAGLDLPFTFTVPTGGFNAFSKWNHFSFQKEYLDIIISPRVNFAFYAGAGVKGLAGLYVRGFVGLTANLHIRPMNKDKFVPEAVLNAGVHIVAEFLFWSIRVKLWEDTWHYDLPQFKLAPGTKAEGSSTEPQYVEPDVQSLSTIHGATNYRTVQLKDDFYAFWIEDSYIGGVTRPWLKCAKLDVKGGSSVFTPVELPYLFVGADGSKPLTDAIKVVHFDVTSTNDLVRRDGDFDMITLAVTYEKMKTILPSPKGDRFITVYDTEFYNIVFFGNGNVYHYSVPGSNITDQSTDSAIIDGSVSIAYDQKIGTDDEDHHASYYYYLMYTLATTASATSVTYGITSIQLTPGRPKTAPYDSFFQQVGRKSQALQFNTTAHPIDQILQTYCLARGVGTANNDIYVLATLKDSQDADGHKKSILIARDAIGELGRPQEIQEETLTGDISAFRFIPGSEKEAGLFALISGRDETGRYGLQLTDHRFGSDGRPHFSPLRDVGVRISPANFDLVNLGASRALYYLESFGNSTSESDAGYNIRAVYLAEGNDGQLFASNSFHLATFNKNDVSVSSGISYLKLYADNAGFIQGFLLEKAESSSGETIISDDGTTVKYKREKVDKLKYLSFRQTLQAEVLDAAPEQVLVKPGDTINVLFSLMNTGNIPASKVTLSAYALKKSSGEKIDLADITINCENPAKSSVTPYDSSLPVTYGTEAVSRYDSPFEGSMDTFVITQNGKTDTYAIDVLMPDETHLYRAGFNVPSSFTPGQYEIYVTFKRMTTRVMLQANRYDAVSAWSKMVYNVDTQSPLSVIPPPTGSGILNGLTTLTMDISDIPTKAVGSSKAAVAYHVERDDDTPSGLLTAVPAATMSGFATTVNKDVDALPLEDADLSIAARLSLQAGVETVHVVIRNEGMADASAISVLASVDETNTFTQALEGVTLGYQKVLSFDIPLQQITGGARGDNLLLTVNGISPETNLHNNTSTLPLDLELKITQQPQDAFVREGDTAEYSVHASGGKKPYTYQWQVSTNGQNGPFADIKGATGESLVLEKVTDKSNGFYYRVVIRDTTGRSAVSYPALLMVSRIPPKTGDSATPVLWLVMMASAFTLMLLLRKKKQS